MQHRKHLVELVRGLFAALRAEPRLDFDALGSQPSIALSFECDGLHMRLVHSEELPQTRNLALIECRLGPIAPGDEEAQYTQLLDLNYRLCATNAAFAIDAVSGDILYTCAFAVDGMTPRALLELVERVEVTYAQWVRTGLEDGDATADPSSMSPEFLQP